jgi:hypothetical protein
MYNGIVIKLRSVKIRVDPFILKNKNTEALTYPRKKIRVVSKKPYKWSYND